MSTSIYHLPSAMTRYGAARSLAAGAVVLAALPSALTAQGKAASQPWHLSAPQLAVECRAAVADMRAAVDAAVRRPLAQQTFGNALLPIEEANGRLNSRASMLASLLYLSPDKAVRDSSTACNQLVTNYTVEFQADPRVYAAALAASREKLSPTDRVLARRYVENGRHGGAALDSATRARTTAMFQRLNDLMRDFSLALSGDSSRITLADSEVASLPEQIKGRIEPRGNEKTLRVDESTIGLFMRNERYSDARRRYLDAFARIGGEANIARLGQAVALRDSLAHLFGFPSWAAYQLDVKVAKTPQRATDFIKHIDEGLLAKARQEYAELQPVAEQDHLGHPIAQWDLSYYSDKLRKARYAVDANEVRKYFPVEHVIGAVLDIYQQLFGIALTEVKPADAWAPNIRQYTVRDATTHALMGTAYLDLFPRPDKFQHFAAFPVVPAWRRADGTRELPVAAIVGNWPAPGGKEPSLLSHGDVITFFHEFGHAVAQLTDRSPYVTIGSGGLRQDFLEAPSQMLENWMWEPAVLARVSKHYETGKPLPDSLIKRMLALKHFRDGFTGTTQAFFAAYDLALHSGNPSADPLALWNKLSTEMEVLPEVEGNLGPAGFGHLMQGYDAGYYGYLWSKVYAQDLYTRFAKEGAMNPRTGHAYREIVVGPAATQEPDTALQRFLGRPLSYDAFFAEMGIGGAGGGKPTP
ncbi:MAG TPA: M3 family metallopeptidase [Gemmatimonadaceae bacterium]